MRRLIWAEQAYLDLGRIAVYIAEFNAPAALDFSARLETAANSLAAFPDRGRIKGRLRELTIISPYIIRYRVDDDQITILRIRHGARRPL